MRTRVLFWILGVVLVVLALAILFPNSATEIRKSEYCTSCITYRTTIEHGLWVYDHHLLDRGTTQTLHPSELSVLLHDEAHVHLWFPNGASWYCFGVKTSVACGGGRWNPLAIVLEHEPAARQRVLARMAQGTLKRASLLRILELPQRPAEGDLEEPGRRALFQEGQEILQSVGFGEHGHWKDALETASLSPR